MAHVEIPHEAWDREHAGIESRDFIPEPSNRLFHWLKLLSHLGSLDSIGPDLLDFGAPDSPAPCPPDPSLILS